MFAVRVLDRGLTGRLNMMRQVEDPRLVKAEAAHAVGDGAHLLR
jgi:hypothetical protein